MSVFGEIERLEGAKNALAASIAGKGVAVPEGTKIDGMAALVDQIQGGGGGADFYIDNAAYLFYNGARFDGYDFFISRLRDVTDMRSMFEYCKKTTSFDFSAVDTSKVVNMSGMFRGSLIDSISTAGIDTSNVDDMSGMFNACQIQTLDLTPFDTGKVRFMSSMFAYCSHLKSIDLDALDTKSVTSMSSFLTSNYELEEILNFSSVGATGQSNMFPSGYSTQVFPLRRLTFKTNLAPGEYAIRSAISIKYCSFERAGMVEMFNTLPDISGLSISANYKKITITGNPCVTKLTLTDEDKAIAIGKGWTIVI